MVRPGPQKCDGGQLQPLRPGEQSPFLAKNADVTTLGTQIALGI